MSKGFTLIEILISFVILSIIRLISSNVLDSALLSQKLSNQKLSNIKELNLASTVMRRDLRQAVNVTGRDFFGNFDKGTFIGNFAEKSISFTTYINDISLETSPLKRVVYYLDDNNLYRRQYYTSNPYLPDDYFESVLIKDINNLNFAYMNDRRWHNSWPVGEITSRKIPTLIRVDFEINNFDYQWIIEPNISYVFQQ